MNHPNDEPEHESSQEDNQNTTLQSASSGTTGNSFVNVTNENGYSEWDNSRDEQTGISDMGQGADLEKPPGAPHISSGAFPTTGYEPNPSSTEDVVDGTEHFQNPEGKL